MKFDFIADAHIDINTKPLVWAEHKSPDSDALVISGDHSNNWLKTLEHLKGAVAIYEQVFFIDGNHDWYGMGINLPDDVGYAEMSRSLASIGVKHINPKNFAFVDSTKNTVIIGANAWYDFNIYGTAAASKKVWMGKSVRKDVSTGKNETGTPNSDSVRVFVDHVTGGPSLIQPEILALEQANALVDLVTSFQDDGMVENILVFTHTVPHRDLVGCPGVPFGTNLMDGAFANSMMERVREADVNQKIKVWGYGHTHNRNDRDIGYIRYINNSRGYGFEDSNWTMIQVDSDDKNPWL